MYRKIAFWYIPEFGSHGLIHFQLSYGGKLNLKCIFSFSKQWFTEQIVSLSF